MIEIFSPRVIRYARTPLAPPETPDEIVAKINKDVAAVLKTEEVRREFLIQGAEPIGNTPEEMASFLDRERALWAGVIEKAGIKAPE